MSNLPTHADETIVWKGSVSHWHYAFRWQLILLLLAAAVAAFIVTLPPSLPPLITAAVLAGLAVILLLSIVLDRAKRTYTITNHRIAVEFGIISKQSNEIRLHDVRSINLTTRGISGLLGIGRLEFSSAATDDAEVVFWNVGHAAGLRDQVRNLQTHEEVGNKE